MVRVGLGYDIHPLVEGRPLILGGVRVPYERGLSGDSDADVLVHAIIDAILGAAGEGDIGRFFGVGDPDLMGVSSLRLLEKARQVIEGKGLAICNIDATVVAEAPRLSPYLDDMKRNIGKALQLDPVLINIKATTAKGLGTIGEGKGMSAQAIVSVSWQPPIGSDS
jgi:2-C-methyl-D-erythritol 2,4-cyclodiphosphate synthase